ncbi:MAG: glycosyltransferase [Bacteroidota bacterium]
MKSILHIITGLEDGGAEAVLYRLITNDSSCKHTVISLMGPGKYGPLLAQKGFTVYSLNMRKGHVTRTGLTFIWECLQNNKYDILQTWMYHADLVGGIIGRFAGITQIYWCIHNSTLVRGQTHWKTLMVTKLCAALSYVVPKKIISCAQRAIEANVSQGYAASKFCLVPNGYDLSLFKPDIFKRKTLREKWQIGDSAFLIGIVARFDPQKDILNLIKALGLVKKRGIDFHLMMVGVGMESSNEELRGWINSSEIEERVILLGQQDNIPEIMNGLDLLTLSSKYGEAFPNVLCEAMACGTPCIATNVGDVSVIISDYGWVVPPESPDLLANAIIQASDEWKDQLLWASKKEEARRHIEENFSIQTMVASYHKVWKVENN